MNKKTPMRSSREPTRGEAAAQRKERSSSEAVAQHKKCQTFLLPWPPSVNGMWRAVEGRNILSQRYRLWRDAAGKALAIQRVSRRSMGGKSGGRAAGRVPIC